jgi:hypothetical protein
LNRRIRVRSIGMTVENEVEEALAVPEEPPELRVGFWKILKGQLYNGMRSAPFNLRGLAGARLADNQDPA